MVVQAGVPVDTAVEGDEHVDPDELPAGDYLTAVHVGPYEGLYGATGALLAYAGHQGLKLDHHPSDAGDVGDGSSGTRPTPPARPGAMDDAARDEARLRASDEISVAGRVRLAAILDASRRRPSSDPSPVLRLDRRHRSPAGTAHARGSTPHR